MKMMYSLCLLWLSVVYAKHGWGPDHDNNMNTDVNEGGPPGSAQLACEDHGNCVPFTGYCGDQGEFGPSVRHFCPKMCGTCGEETCFDLDSENCARFTGYCHDVGSFGPSVRHFCRKSCGICDDDSIIGMAAQRPDDETVYRGCQDEDGFAEQCAMYVKYCEDEGNFGPYVRRHCPKTCGCSTDEENENEDYQGDQPLDSCTDDPDQQEQCDLYAGYCKDQGSFGPYLRRICRKTCGTC